MIAVVADDLTGSAEIGAIGLRYDLAGIISTKSDDIAAAELAILDTDTRSCSPQGARAEVEKAAGKLLFRKPAWFYKKVDSVLRGRVYDELVALLVGLNKPRALLIPANPSLGRIIREGRYFLDGRPVDQSSFADDPEHPIRSSDVLEMLGPPQSQPVSLRRCHERLPETGIVIGEASSSRDLAIWASRLDAETLPAGAAEFFEAIMAARGFRATTSSLEEGPLLRPPSLFLSGSTSSSSYNFLRKAGKAGLPVISMPADLMDQSSQAEFLIRTWVDSVVEAFKRHHRVIAAIDQPTSSDPDAPVILGGHMVRLAEEVFRRMALEHLLVEGGATASAIVRGLGWTRLKIVHEWAPGVVSLKASGSTCRLLTIKPGSYQWPERIWKPGFPVDLPS